MSLLYVSSFEENAKTRWGIFYVDSKGIQHLSEDFKNVSFDTEDEAKSLNIDDISSAITIKSSNMVFDVFFEIIKKYLEDLNG